MTVNCKLKLHYEIKIHVMCSNYTLSDGINKENKIKIILLDQVKTKFISMVRGTRKSLPCQLTFCRQMQKCPPVTENNIFFLNII